MNEKEFTEILYGLFHLSEIDVVDETILAKDLIYSQRQRMQEMELVPPLLIVPP